MILPLFTPIYRAIDEKRLCILDNIENTAQSMVKGGIVYDVGLDCLMKQISELEQLEFVHENLQKVEHLVGSILPNETLHKKGKNNETR